MFYLILITFVTLLIYSKLKKYHKVWELKGVPHTKPTLLFGHAMENVLQKQSPADVLNNLYNKFYHERYFGLYQFLVPILVIKDLELIKQMTVKHFDAFPNHSTFVAEDRDPLWGENLFVSEGQKWRDLRSTLSPAFTSSKMKIMFNLMMECSEHFCNFFLGKNKDIIEVQLRDIMTRFANDVIASTTFGVKCDSLKEPNNEFYSMGTEATNFRGIRGLKFILYSFSPFLMKVLNVKIFGNKVASFFRSVIKENIKGRIEKGIVRPDMIHLLLEARKGELEYEENELLETGFATAKESNLGKHIKTRGLSLTDNNITAQALIFFVGGYDTTSILLCYIAYELSINPDIQDRLRQEVDDVYEKCNGKLTYEALVKMKYLDMVVSETLRKWPPGIVLHRVSVVPYTIEPSKPGEKPLHLDKGSTVWIPVYSLHRNPEYHPNPEKFDPERFSDANKHKIKPYSYVPFASGPRNCIGSRFAIMENKILFFHILRQFEIVCTEKTPTTIKFDPQSSNLIPNCGLHVALKRRRLP